MLFHISHMLRYSCDQVTFAAFSGKSTCFQVCLQFFHSELNWCLFAKSVRLRSTMGMKHLCFECRCFLGLYAVPRLGCTFTCLTLFKCSSGTIRSRLRTLLTCQTCPNSTGIFLPVGDAAATHDTFSLIVHKPSTARTAMLGLLCFSHAYNAACVHSHRHQSHRMSPDTCHLTVGQRAPRCTRIDTCSE